MRRSFADVVVMLAQMQYLHVAERVLKGPSSNYILLLYYTLSRLLLAKHRLQTGFTIS